MSERGTFTTFETSGGGIIHRIPLEAFPNFWVYAYLVQKDSYCVLIDAGSGADTSHENLLSGFYQAEIQPSELTHIFLTHAHIDHFGGLAKVRPLTSARIGCHELDVQTVAHHEASLARTGQRLTSFLAETGLAEETREQVLSIYRFSKALYQSVPVDFTYEAIDMQLGPFELVHLPGHCPGHVAIRVDDVIFCGDMIVEGVTPHLSPASMNPYGGARPLSRVSHTPSALVRRCTPPFQRARRCNHGSAQTGRVDEEKYPSPDEQSRRGVTSATHHRRNLPVCLWGNRRVQPTARDRKDGCVRGIPLRTRHDRDCQSRGSRTRRSSTLSEITRRDEYDG